MTATASVDLLFVPDCPNVAIARQRIVDAMVAAGVRGEVREREITDADEAAVAGMNGSPTILVNGRDVAGGEAVGSFSCRLYRTATGSDAAPTLNQIVEALRS